jgi:Flp pilus assembly protein TadD
MRLPLRPLALVLLLALSACASLQAAPPARHDEQLSVDQLLGIAAALETNGDALRAPQYLLAALKAGADEARVVPWLLRLYIQDGQYRLAIEHAEHALRRAPDDRGLRMLLASMYSALELESAAIQQYQRLLEGAPDDATAHYALATLLHDHGDASQADEHYRAYLTLDPKGAHAAEARSLLLTELP